MKCKIKEIWKGPRSCNGLGWGGCGSSSLAQAGKFKIVYLFHSVKFVFQIYFSLAQAGKFKFHNCLSFKIQSNLMSRCMELATNLDWFIFIYISKRHMMYQLISRCMEWPIRIYLRSLTTLWYAINSRFFLH